MAAIDTRYAPGNELYLSIEQRYGTDAADRVYKAAASGKDGAIADALAIIRRGPALNESTLSIFGEQLLNDPFAAPLESANRQLGKLSLNLLKNPLAAVAIVVVVIVVVVAFVPGAKAYFTRLIPKAG